MVASPTRLTVGRSGKAEFHDLNMDPRIAVRRRERHKAKRELRRAGKSLLRRVRLTFSARRSDISRHRRRKNSIWSRDQRPLRGEWNYISIVLRVFAFESHGRFHFSVCHGP